VSRRWPGGAVGTLALVLAVELFVARHQDLDFATVWAAGWKHTGALARGRAAGCEVLCLGDSLVKFGVVPRVLEDRLGGRAINLALCVGQPPAALAVLRRALEAGARPKVVLVDFTEHLLARGPRKNARLWPELLSAGECLDLAWTARDPGLLAELLLSRLSPSIKDRYEIRASLLAAFRGAWTVDREVLPSFWRNWNHNAGAQGNAPLSNLSMKFEAWFRDVYPERFACDPVQAAYIDRFLDLAASRGIPVVWLLPPYHPEFQALSERKGIDAQYVAFVRAVQGRHPGLTVLDGRHAAYPHAVFGDPIHLDCRGAVAYTAAVADAVARRLAGGPAGPRWLTLPAYRDRPADPRLEDLAQSAAALRR
jgi:hypothetical protein